LVRSDHPVALVMDIALAALPWLFPVVFYYSYARPAVSFWGYVWRIITFYILLLVIMFVMIFLLAIITTNGTSLEGELYFGR
jgi:hypothetical protein